MSAFSTVSWSIKIATTLLHFFIIKSFFKACMTKLLCPDDMIYIRLQCFNWLTFLLNIQIAVLFQLISSGKDILKVVLKQLREIDTL